VVPLTVFLATIPVGPINIPLSGRPVLAFIAPTTIAPSVPKLTLPLSVSLADLLSLVLAAASAAAALS